MKLRPEPTDAPGARVADSHTHRRLDQLIHEQQQTNRLLWAMLTPEQKAQVSGGS